MPRHTLIQTDRQTRATGQDSFRSDCSKCKGICCVVLPFDRDQGFGFDKAACEPCPKLNADFSCAIHSSLEACGFSGCSRYECFGAGQRITRALDLRDDWFRDEAMLALVYKWFRASRELHEKLVLLDDCLDELQQQALRGSGEAPAGSGYIR